MRSRLAGQPINVLTYGDYLARVNAYSTAAATATGADSPPAAAQFDMHADYLKRVAWSRTARHDELLDLDMNEARNMNFREWRRRIIAHDAAVISGSPTEQIHSATWRQIRNASARVAGDPAPIEDGVAPTRLLGILGADSIRVSRTEKDQIQALLGP
jgi:hypothetical protein